MQKYQDSKLKIYITRMILWAYVPLNNFPRSEMHGLSAMTRECLYRLLELIIKVERKHYKLTDMTELDCKLGFLGSLVGIAQERHYISIKQYETWVKHIAEIGKMIGGLIKWAKEKAEADAERKKQEGLRKKG